MFRTIDEIKQANENANQHFFAKDTMHCFNSRVGQTVFLGCYFITSERFDEQSPRLYTVRKALPDGNILTVSKFQQFETRKQAVSFINSL